MEKGFWLQLAKPIIGLAPMDGVTDAPFRFIAAKYGKAHLHITEFTSVEGICHGAIKSLKAFVYDEVERPIVAQVFGSDPESFYKSAFVVCELGFDGIDINMGCPAQSVASKGAGASLIRTPELAKMIIKRTKDAVKDWAGGRQIEDVGLPENIVEHVKKMQPTPVKRQTLPVSVKTRIGYNEIVIEEWIKHLLEEEPVNITVHGRTLKQMYTGSADWEAIGRAAKLVHQTETTILGNGDIHSVQEGLERVQTYGVDGFLIGRASFGNPWLFGEKQRETIDPKEAFKVAIEHSHLYGKIFQDSHFIPMRKHLAWYCKGFHGASELRQQLMKTNTALEVETTLNNFFIAETESSI